MAIPAAHGATAAATKAAAAAAAIPLSLRPHPLTPAPSFYKRPLPASCVPFGSAKGKALFRTALAEGNMEAYFPLAGQFLTQQEPAYCGLGTLCMILNALEVDPQRQWKGPWRWYEQEMLDCCRPLSAVEKVGVTLSEFACLARCNGLHAEVVSPLQTIDHQRALRKFREDLKRANTTTGTLMALSYSRAALGQTGDGHFSPIAGYAEKDDMVLILDVARFKYPSYWVSVPDAWNSLLPLDKATGQPRGYSLLSLLPPSDPTSLAAPLSLTTLSLNKSSWATLNASFSKLLLSFAPSKPASEVLASIFAHLATLPTPALTARASSTASLPPLIARLQPTRLSALGVDSDSLAPLLIIALFSSTSNLLPLVPTEMREGISEMVREALDVGGEEVVKEVDVLKRQLAALGECCRAEEEGAQCGCSSPGAGDKTCAM